VNATSRAAPVIGTASRAMEVLDADAIRALPASSITDVLRLGLGVDMMSRSPALADMAIRGSSYEQVLILVDGVRLRDAQTGHFNLNLAVPFDQVERIEILRGPASSLYGSDALGGVINIVTRSQGSRATARLGRGSFATTGIDVSARAPAGPVALDVAGNYLDSDGHRAGTDVQLGAGRFLASLPVGGAPLVADVAYTARDFGAAGFYGNYPAFESVRTTTASARWRLSPGSVTSIEPVFSWRHNSDDFLLDRNNPTGYRNRHETDGFVGEVIGRTKLGGGSLAAGLHGSREGLKSASLGNRSEWSVGASVELAAGSTSGVSATAGLRGDRLSSGDFALSPSIAGAWHPRGWLRLRSSAGEAFRAPTWTERYYSDPVNIGTPDLSPERAWTFDGGVDIEVGGVTSSLTGWVRSARDLIDWARPVGETIYETRNVNSATFRGLEAQLRDGDLAGFAVAIKGDWLTVSSAAADGFESKYALRPLAQNFSLSIERQVGWVSGGFRLANQRRVGEPSWLLADARLALHAQDFTLRIDGLNLGDELYRDIVGYPAPGRSITVGIDWLTVGAR
jgi:iron complex outermembrane receptor protein